MTHPRKQKKFKPCGHLNYGRTCARCKEADKKEAQGDEYEAVFLRKPTHKINSKYRQRIIVGNHNG